jgi:hypothetical protein
LAGRVTKPARSRFLAALVVVATAACGSRTALFGGGPSDTEETSEDGGLALVDGGVLRDGGVDAARDANVVVETDAGCASDVDCDDGVACTLDRCRDGLCVRELVDARCDDGVFCNGEEACGLNGCAPRPSPCNDGISCSVDSCVEQSRTCRFIPDDTQCPPSHVCDLDLGCQARALAHDTTNLYDVRVPSGKTTLIGATRTTLTDIALTPGNRLYGVNYDGLFDVDTTTGAATRRASLGTGNYIGFDLAPDGRLFVGGGTRIATLDIASAVLTTFTTIPSAASGDIAFVGNRMLVTVRGVTNDDLVEVDLTTRASKRLGNVGYACIWGLAAYGPTLYGFTCEGFILDIDTTTGKGTPVTKTNIEFYGATAR